MTSFKVDILGQAAVDASLAAKDAAAREALKAQILKSANQLRAYVVSNKLSGQVLHRRTGNLAASVNDFEAGQVTESGDQIYAQVGTPVWYGRIHELGGSFTVPEHERTSVLGKRYTVGSYTAHFPQRSFLFSSLTENEAKIRADIAASITGALNG